MVLIRQGRIAQGGDHLRETLRVEPEHAGAANNLNWLLGIQRKIDDAVAEMNAAFLLLPIPSDFKDGIQRLYHSKKELDAAVHQFQKGLMSLTGFNPKELNIENYPKVSDAIGKYVRIQPLAEKLQKSGDKGMKAYYGACLCALQDRVKESVNRLAQAVKAGFKDWDLLQTDPNMEKIRATAYYRELMHNR